VCCRATIDALCRCAEALGEPELAVPAAALVPVAAARVRAGASSADVVLGRAGLLLALLKLWRQGLPPAPGLAVLVGELHEQLLIDLDRIVDLDRTAAATLSPYPSRYPPLVGLPAGPDGVVYALARSARILDRADTDHAIRRRSPTCRPPERPATG
jgi:hypothetical protein